MNQMSEACDEIPIHKNQSQIETKRVRGTITAQIHPKSSIRHRFVTSFHLASVPSLFLRLYPSFCVYRKPELYILSFFGHTWLTDPSANGSAVGVRRTMRSTNHRPEWYRFVWRNNRGRGLLEARELPYLFELCLVTRVLLFKSDTEKDKGRFPLSISWNIKR